MEPYVVDLHAEAELYKVLAASVPNPPHNIFSLTVIAFLPCRFKSHFEENSRDIGKNYKFLGKIVVFVGNLNLSVLFSEYA
jgi:hypothetical protein